MVLSNVNHAKNVNDAREYVGDFNTSPSPGVFLIGEIHSAC